METVWARVGHHEGRRFPGHRCCEGHLLELYGFPTYTQQLLYDGRIVADTSTVNAGMDLQMVLLTISGLSSGSISRLAEADLEDARRNHAVTARFLLDAGLLRDGEHMLSGAPSLLLASQENHSEVVRLLLEAGVDTDCWAPVRDCADRVGWTALMPAALHGHLEVARVLLEAGARTNCVDNKSTTALMLACGMGHF